MGFFWSVLKEQVYSIIFQESSAMAYFSNFSLNLFIWYGAYVFKREALILIILKYSMYWLFYLGCCKFWEYQFSSVTQSCPNLCDPMGTARRPPCPSPTPRVYSNSCPLSRWCHPTISSSVIPFSSCPQSFPASGSFPVSQLFTSGGQSVGVSASTSFLPMNTQDWSPLGWTDWLDHLAVQGTLKSLLQHHISKALVLRGSAFSTVQLSHPYLTTGKTIALTRWTFVDKVMSLLFNMLSRLVITFLPRIKCL